MTTVETRVRQLVQEYCGVFVNYRTQLQDESSRHKNYVHMLEWVCRHYRQRHPGSDLAWSMRDCRAVTEAVKGLVEEILQ